VRSQLSAWLLVSLAKLMKGDVLTLATVAESRVSAYSMAVIFPALIYIEGISTISDHLNA
jgi:hypothetical protein